MRFKIFIFVDFLAKVEAFIGGSLPTTLPTTLPSTLPTTTFFHQTSNIASIVVTTDLSSARTAHITIIYIFST